MTIKDLKSLCTLRNNIIVEAVRIERKDTNMKKSIKRIWDNYCHVACLFPDSTFMEEEFRDFLVDFIADRGLITKECHDVNPEEVRNRIVLGLNSVFLSIAMDYEENRLNFD